MEGLKAALLAQSKSSEQSEAARYVFLYYVFLPLLDADADGVVSRSEMYRLQLVAGDTILCAICAVHSCMTCLQTPNGTHIWPMVPTDVSPFQARHAPCCFWPMDLLLFLAQACS